MIWTRRKKEQKNKEEKSKRSEEVADIIDRMPTQFGKWASIAVLTFAFLLFFFGWIIKYPDVITGAIEITSNVSPVKLVAHTSGKIRLAGFTAQDSVSEGEYIAVIQNPAKTEDVYLVSALLKQLNPNDISRPEIRNLFPEKVTLGELNLKYYTFLAALKTACEYLEQNIYEQQLQSLTDEIQWKKRILAETENVLETVDENLELSQKWYDKYSSLNNELLTTYEYEVDRNKMEFLSIKQNKQNLQKEAVSIRMQIADTENRLLQSGTEKREKERQMLLDLLAAYHDLSDNIKVWEEQYLLKAPFSGKVEFLGFWENDQFIQSGTEIFSIVPQNSLPVGQMLLPANGAGKAKTGSKVRVKLENYPYEEFGYIEGKVKSISLVSQQYNSGTKNIDAYLVSIDMFQGLTTNYGESLDFRYKIRGSADIIVKDRRLIERLFDNLKSKTK
ncbi:MAG: HlyD family secretion protein [Dysgonamonadaceae bacterium]|jgi:multidrug resistance efflux pump|nr:HlyD family secretion protein [Dysgonamonadaceae bacterium]